jgi:hypothetical protein
MASSLHANSVVFEVDVQRVRRIASAILILGTSLVIVLGAAGQIFRYILNVPTMRGLIDLLYVDADGNVAAWYLSILFLAASATLGLIAAIKHASDDPFRRHWIGLALMFALLSCDVVAGIHETLGWAIPIVFAAVVFGAYVRFWANLPVSTRRLVLLSLLTYIAATVGIEACSVYYAKSHGEMNLVYAGIVTLEECFKMFSLVLFIRTILGYLNSLSFDFTFHPAGRRWLCWQSGDLQTFRFVRLPWDRPVSNP